MSEHETAGEPVGEEHESWWQRALSVGGKAHGVSEVVEHAHAAHEVGAHGGVGVGNVLAPLALGSGINEMVHGHGMEKVAGGLEAVSGGVGTVGLLGAGANAVGNSLITAGLAGDIGAASTVGVNAGASLIGGGTSMIGAAEALGPVGALAGAGAAGIGIGTAMSHAADSEYTRTGLWGKDENGRNNSAMDAATNWGLDYDREHGVKPGDWSLGGAARSMVGSIGAGVAGTAQAGYNASGLGGVVDGAVAGVGNAADGVTNWFGGLNQTIRHVNGL